MRDADEWENFIQFWQYVHLNVSLRLTVLYIHEVSNCQWSDISIYQES